MPPFLYRCPNTGYPVQGFTAEKVSGKDADAIVTVACILCEQVHLVNPVIGKLAGVEAPFRY